MRLELQDVVVLVNALLVLTALIPIIPNLEAAILQDIFEGFSRLAAWNYSNQPKQPEVPLKTLTQQTNRSSCWLHKRSTKY